MTKRPARPGASLNASRKLVGGEASVSQTSQTWHCLACAWRKFSNESLKELRSRNPDMPESYDGLLAGFKDGNIVIGQFIKNKQIGFVSIPIQNFTAVISDLMRTYESAYAEISSQMDAEMREKGFIDDEGNLTEAGYEALGLTPEQVAEIEAAKGRDDEAEQEETIGIQEVEEA